MMKPTDEIREIVRKSLLTWNLAGVSSLPGEGLPESTERAEDSFLRETREHTVPTPDPGRASHSFPDPSLPNINSDMPRSSKKVSPITKSVPTADPGAQLTTQSTLNRTERERVLHDLSMRVADCTRCSALAKTRTQTVFGVGNPEARLLFLGEAPGADEDKQGEPFVGRAGQLMNKIIEAMKLKREDLYICNILRCRPPGNRAPEPEESNNCREWLDAQLRIVDPDYIVCWGAVAAQNLLSTTEAISKLRGRFMQYGRSKVLCTYHPSYLLRNPSAKKPVWEDMQMLLKEMGLPVPG